MARWTVRPGLAYCIIDDQAVFLDLEADRYFRLSKGTTASFLASVAGETSADANLSLIAEAILVPASCASIIDTPPLKMPTTSLEIGAGPPIGLRWGLAAILIAVAVRLKLRIYPRALMRNGVKLRWLPDAPLPSGDAALSMMVRAFDWATCLLPIKLNCVCRSYGLKRLLRSGGVNTDLVIGVRLQPFLAHCWLQQGTRIIGDNVDEVGAFTPIAVIA